MWSFWIVDTQSGDKQLQVEPSDGRWRAVINGIGQGTHAFQLRDTRTALPRATWQGLVRPWARTLVVCWDDTPLYAGVILRHRWDRTSGVLTVEHSELRVIFSRRFSFMVPTHTPGGSFTLSGKSLRGLVRGVVARGAHSIPGDNWHLPVVLPADEAGSQSRTWFNYLFTSIEEMVTEVQNTDGGPDVHLQPRWSAAGKLEWLLRLGTPKLTGGTFEYNASAQASSATDVTQVTDATKQLSGVFALGAGSEEDMRVGKAGGLAGTDIPDMDTSRSFKDKDVISELDGLALSELKTFREPTVQVGFGTLATETPGADALVLGWTLRLWVDGDEFMNDGWRTSYLVGMSGDMSMRVGLEIQ